VIIDVQFELAFLFVLSVSFIADLAPQSAWDVAAAAAAAASDNEGWIELAWCRVRWKACVLNLRILCADVVFS
jgi:hypothetical protein